MPKTLKEYADTDRARAYRNRQRKINYDRDGSDRHRSREPWTRHEIDMILERKLTDREVARIMGRSVKAIQIKRCRLKHGQGHR